MREFKVDNINTLKIAGIHSILGVDYYQDTIRVVELRSRGGVFNKFRAVYKVVNYFKFQLPIDASNFERGRLLFDELKTRGVHCRFCVSTVRSSTMKVVTAELPEDAENINEWITQFNWISNINQWTDDVKCALLPGYLEDVAKIWYSTLSVRDRSSYQIVKERLQQVFQQVT